MIYPEELVRALHRRAGIRHVLRLIESWQRTPTCAPMAIDDLPHDRAKMSSDAVDDLFDTLTAMHEEQDRQISAFRISKKGEPDAGNG